jgi:cobalamin biosynthesis protein CbiD
MYLDTLNVVDKSNFIGSFIEHLRTVEWSMVHLVGHIAPVTGLRICRS